MFDPGIIHLIDRPKIGSPMNALTLTLDYHRQFGEFKIYFEHTGTRHQYRIDSTERSPFLRDPLLPVTQSFTLNPHRTIDPPSPRILGVHRAIGLIMNLSGAGEYIERVLRDMEELDERRWIDTFGISCKLTTWRMVRYPISALEIRMMDDIGISPNVIVLQSSNTTTRLY